LLIIIDSEQIKLFESYSSLQNNCSRVCSVVSRTPSALCPFNNHMVQQTDHETEKPKPVMPSIL